MCKEQLLTQLKFSSGETLMGLRFRKSFKIAPGVKINLNKKSAGVTIGTKGAHYTINTSGKRTASVGLPGTGLSYSTTSGGGKKGTRNAQKPRSKKAGFQKGIGILIAVIAIVCAAGAIKDSLNKKAESALQTDNQAVSSPAADTDAQQPPAADAADTTAEKVWISDSGSKYHTKADCSGMEDASEVSLQEALDMGREACKRCD